MSPRRSPKRPQRYGRDVSELRLMNVRLSEKAHRGLEAFAVTHGVTLTSMVEAWGCALDEHVPTPDEVAGSDFLSHLIKEARHIDLERRSRRVKTPLPRRRKS